MMNDWVRVRQMRRATGGNKKLFGRLEQSATKLARQFKRDHSAHAVTKKRERFVKQWLNILRKFMYHARHLFNGGFVEARSSAGIMNNNAFDGTRKVLTPLGEDRRSATRIWE